MTEGKNFIIGLIIALLAILVASMIYCFIDRLRQRKKLKRGQGSQKSTPPQWLIRSTKIIITSQPKNCNPYFSYLLKTKNLSKIYSEENYVH